MSPDIERAQDRYAHEVALHGLNHPATEKAARDLDVAYAWDHADRLSEKWSDDRIRQLHVLLTGYLYGFCEPCGAPSGFDHVGDCEGVSDE